MPGLYSGHPTSQRIPKSDTVGHPKSKQNKCIQMWHAGNLWQLAWREDATWQGLFAWKRSDRSISDAWLYKPFIVHTLSLFKTYEPKYAPNTRGNHALEKGVTDRLAVMRIKPILKIFNECRSLTGVGRIKPLFKIFNKCRNECRSLTGWGELNPYWRSSMNVEV